LRWSRALTGGDAAGDVRVEAESSTATADVAVSVRHTLVVGVLDADAAGRSAARLFDADVLVVVTAIAVAFAGSIAVAGAAVALAIAGVFTAVDGTGWWVASTNLAPVRTDLEAVGAGDLTEDGLAALGLDTDATAVGATVSGVAVVVRVVDTLEAIRTLNVAEAAAERRRFYASTWLLHAHTGGVGVAAVRVGLTVATADRAKDFDAGLWDFHADTAGIGETTVGLIVVVAVLVGSAGVAEPSAAGGFFGRIADVHFVVAAVAVVAAAFVAPAAASGLAAAGVFAGVEMVCLGATEGAAVRVRLKFRFVGTGNEGEESEREDECFNRHAGSY
jgi:hypothetical protein